MDGGSQCGKSSAKSNNLQAYPVEDNSQYQSCRSRDDVENRVVYHSISSFTAIILYNNSAILHPVADGLWQIEPVRRIIWAAERVVYKSSINRGQAPNAPPPIPCR